MENNTRSLKPRDLQAVAGILGGHGFRCSVNGATNLDTNILARDLRATSPSASDSNKVWATSKFTVPQDPLSHRLVATSQIPHRQSTSSGHMHMQAAQPIRSQSIDRGDSSGHHRLYHPACPVTVKHTVRASCVNTTLTCCITISMHIHTSHLILFQIGLITWSPGTLAQRV